MTLNKAVDFFGGFMRNFSNVRMASFAFYLGVHTVAKDGFIDIKEFELSFSIDDADTGILVSQKTVSDICSERSRYRKTYENQNRQTKGEINF